MTQKKNRIIAGLVICLALLAHMGLNSAAETDQSKAPPKNEAQTKTEVASKTEEPSKGSQKSHPAVVVAKKMLGKPYRYGGASPDRGFDCSGLVYYSFKHVGINLPRTSANLYRHAFKVAPEEMRQGDLLFFRINGKVSHVGIYLEGKTFLHAPQSGKVVRLGSLDNPYWKKHFLSAGRVFELRAILPLLSH